MTNLIQSLTHTAERWLWGENTQLKNYQVSLEELEARAKNIPSMEPKDLLILLWECKVLERNINKEVQSRYTGKWKAILNRLAEIERTILDD